MYNYYYQSLLALIRSTTKKIILKIICCRSNDPTATRMEADRCWKTGVQLMVVGVDGAVSGDVWALRELRAVSRCQTSISDDHRPRRMFLSHNFESLGNTRRPITDALCASTSTVHRVAKKTLPT